MAVKPIPEGYSNVIPYIICKDSEKIIDFCREVFGARISDMSKLDDGTIVHATIHIRDSAVMFSEASGKYPAMPAMVNIYFEDVDSVYKKAIAAGAKPIKEPANEFYGDRSAGVMDISGNQWWFATHIEDVSAEEISKRHKELKK